MGILNITPDSFYSGSRLYDLAPLKAKVEQMIHDGADILDVGACSTRPGAAAVAPDEELKRLEPALAFIRDKHPEILVSLDTFRVGVVKRMVRDYQVDMVNDISGGSMDPEMFSTVASLQLPYVLMHMKGQPADMQEHARYDNVLREILHHLSLKIRTLNAEGVNDIILDPGFGFAKNIRHNFEILSRLEAFHCHALPLMVGISRKSMIYRSLGCSPDEALNGSTVIHSLALLKGAGILRVHDVSEAREAISLLARSGGLPVQERLIFS